MLSNSSLSLFDIGSFLCLLGHTCLSVCTCTVNQTADRTKAFFLLLLNRDSPNPGIQGAGLLSAVGESVPTSQTHQESGTASPAAMGWFQGKVQVMTMLTTCKRTCWSWSLGMMALYLLPAETQCAPRHGDRCPENLSKWRIQQLFCCISLQNNKQQRQHSSNSYHCVCFWYSSLHIQGAVHMLAPLCWHSLGETSSWNCHRPKVMRMVK